MSPKRPANTSRWLLRVARKEEEGDADVAIQIAVAIAAIATVAVIAAIVATAIAEGLKVEA